MCYSQGIITKKTLQVVQIEKSWDWKESNSRVQDALQKRERDEVDAVGFNEIIPEIYTVFYKTKLPHWKYCEEETSMSGRFRLWTAYLKFCWKWIKVYL